MITFLIYFLVFVIVCGLVWYVLSQVPLPPEVAWIVRIVVVVVMCVILIWLLLSLVGGGSGLPAPR